MTVANANDNVNNGFFQLSYLEDGVYLTVYPPVANGKKVTLNDVTERLVRKQIKDYTQESVKAAVDTANKIPVKIAGPQKEISIDSTASVMIAPDKMKGFISFTPPDNGRMLTFEETLEILNRSGVIYGIKKKELESIVNYPIFNEMICVAEGTPPVKGKDGRIEYHFETEKEYKPSILEDGRVDFRELNLIQTAIQGQKLCTLIPPGIGTQGKTVTGTDIPCQQGRPAVLPRGRNAVASEDGMSLIAHITGQITYQDGKINIFSVYEVPADVDNSTGNINFIGNVAVRGNVLAGFVIEAGGNVEVWGVVEGAHIKAGGDIILRRGMQGMGKGVLSSGGDIIARYIENSFIEAKNNIKSEAIMHSNVKCGNKLELTGKKGLLVGGVCKVGKEISAKVIGSYMATTTDIEVGVDPTLKEHYKKLKDTIHSMEDDIRKADQATVILKKLEIAGALSPEKKELLSRSIRTKVYYSSKLIELKEELAHIDARLQQETYGKIRALNFIYPGTKVTIGSSMMYVKENLQYCTLYRDGADIRVGPIDK